MRGGHVDAITRKAVAGWAADSDRPDERLVLSIAVNGRVAGQTTADRLRRDLANLGRFGDGRHGFAFDFPEPLDPGQDHLISVTFAEDGAAVPNGEHRLAASPQGQQPHPAPLPAASPTAPVQGAGSPMAPAQGAASPTAQIQGLKPILVTAPGRSGTTLLMGLLARSPAIVAAELVPYELRLLSYYTAANQVLTAPADLERSTHPDRLEGDGLHIGFNPFHGPQYAPAFRNQAPLRDFYEAFAPERTRAYVRDLVGEYYARLARDKGKDGALYFAEKGNNLHKPVRVFTRRVFGAVRELVIVRDPRDVLCSHMAYFSSTPEKAFTQLSHAARQLQAIREEAGDDTLIFKYEDMVGGDPATFARISGFLGTRIDPEAGGAAQDVFRKHGTSVSPEASIARWRTNLPPALQARCAKDWASFLTTFGYPLS